MPPQAIDWSQLWYPGPSREFSAAELARAGGDTPSRTLVVVLMINLAYFALALLIVAPAGITAQLTSLLIAVAVAGTAQSRALWRRPTRQALMWHSLGAGAVVWLMVTGWIWRVNDRGLRSWLVSVGCLAALSLVVALWLVTMFRAQQIAAKLRELDERERAAEMARQLLAAQIQPHFLFNTLAALQHWVLTRDERASELLTALTAYLRATLPLFQRQHLPLGDELQVVRHYLHVMQLRLGQRLRFEIDVPEPLWPLPLPPGLVLTLVENAIGHGIEPQLHGGCVRLRAQQTGALLCIEVIDDGPGPGAGASEGLGLGNVRARLRQAYGDAATLALQAAPGGGACATLTIPVA